MKKLILSSLVAVVLIGSAEAQNLTPVSINGDRMINDSSLNVTWADFDFQGYLSSTSYTASPLSLVAFLNSNNYGGHNDWQVPTGNGLYTTQQNGFGDSTDKVQNQLGWLLNNELGNNNGNYNSINNFYPFINLQQGNVGTSTGHWRYNLYNGWNYLYYDEYYTANRAGFGTIAVRTGVTPLTSLPSISINSQPTNVSLTGTNSQTATFSVVATNGVPPYGYQWMKDGVDLTNQTNPSLVFSNAGANKVGYYTCDVTDQTGTTVTSSNAALNITGVNFNLWQGLVAFYPFNGNADDATGNGYNAYISNDTQGIPAGDSNNCTLTTNRFRQNNSAYNFTGQLGSVSSGFLPSYQACSSWMTVSNSSSLMASLTNWSLSVIVKINGPGDYAGSQFILDNCKDYQGTGLSFGYSETNQLASGIGVGFFVISANWGYPGNLVFAPKQITYGSYYYVTTTYNGTTASIYINGSLITQTIADLSFPLINNINIGRHLAGPIANAPGYYGSLNGVLDDIKIYNRALSSNEVVSLFAQESTSATGTNNQTIGFPGIPPKPYGTAPFTLAATSSAGTNYPITYSSSDTNVATIIGNTVTIRGVGTTAITATQAGAYPYKAATPVQRPFTVTKGKQTLSPFTPIADKTFGNAPFAITTPVASSGLPVTVSVKSGPGSISNNILTITGAGLIRLSANQAGNANYLPAPAGSAVLVVNKASQTITFTPQATQSFVSKGTFSLSASSSAGKPIKFSSGNPSVLSITGNTAIMKARGTVVVTASAIGDANTSAGSTTASITVQ